MAEKYDRLVIAEIIVHSPDCPFAQNSGECGNSRSGTKPMAISTEEFGDRWYNTFGNDKRKRAVS